MSTQLWNSKEDEKTWKTAHEQVTGGKHKAELSHELIAAAASYEAAKAWEAHHAKEGGKPSSHEKAKELFAGVIGAFVDREVETRGLDFIDKEKAKREARRQAEEQLARHY